MEAIKRLPVGISDFKTLQRSHKYFVDKTKYLPLLEEISNFLFLIRPRRFGKSLFLSMVADYFDCANKDIESEYKGTWIESHPLESKGKFQILQFDFSQVLDKIENLEDDFNTYCCSCLNQFIQKYQDYYTPDTVEWALAATTSKDKINILAKEAKERGYHLYLIIDEYDNFTNTVLNELGKDTYHNMTHSSGFYRSAFKIFKPNFERILFMGVSPITLNDLTSGFNIATNISLHPWFNMMLGFSEEEVRQMIFYYISVGLIKTSDSANENIDEEEGINKIIAEMKPWYDNYCFSEDRYNIDLSMYNSNMVLYYLNNLITTGKAPKEMADPSCRTDYAKLKNLVRLDRLDGDRKGVLMKIAEKGYIDAPIADSFAAEEVMNPDRFVSLLYYYGMLTIGGTDLDALHLVIPNNTIRKLYYDFLVEQYQSLHGLDLNDLSAMYRKAAQEGEDDIINERATIDDVDPKAIKYFLRKAVDAERMPVESLNDPPTRQVPDKYPASSEGSKELLHVIGIHTFSIKEIMALLKLKDRENFMVNYLIPAIKKGYITPLYPNSPHHPKQKYLLTEKGKERLEREDGTHFTK